MAREGWIIVAAFFLGAILISALGAWLFGTIGGFLAALFAIPLALWSFWFFRDPARRIPTEPGLIVSPADGVCCFAGPASPPAELGLPAADRRRISIFMNVFNVHVNRAPIAGTVERIEYRPGRYFNASLDKASEHNERSGMVLALADGRRLACVQIAGLVARRIVSRVQPGDRLTTGERYGLIRFGSRVDVYLPEGVEPLVKLGDRMVAGETIIGRLVPAPAPPPQVHIPAQTHTAIP